MIVLDSHSLLAHVLVCILIGILWQWSHLPSKPSNPLAPFLRSVNQQGNVGYLGALFLVSLSGSLTLVSPKGAATAQTSPFAAGLFALVAWMVYVVYHRFSSPQHTIWHRRRLKPLMAVLGLILMVTNGGLHGGAPLLGLILLVAIFQRQRRRGRQVLEDLMDQQERLKEKIISLEADLNQRRFISASKSIALHADSGSVAHRKIS